MNLDNIQIIGNEVSEEDMFFGGYVVESVGENGEVLTRDIFMEVNEMLDFYNFMRS